MLSSFVNVLGIMEYICAFYIEDQRYAEPMRMLLRMNELGGAWAQIVVNVFAKYDGSIDMLCRTIRQSGQPSIAMLNSIILFRGQLSRPVMA